MIVPEMGVWKIWFGRPQPHLDTLKQLYTMASTDILVNQRQMAVGENHLRPHLIHFNRCRNILLEDFIIRESPFWTIHFYMCDGGIIRGIDVKAKGHNNDGVDLEMSRNLLIENCTFNQGDDAVVIKSGRNQDAWRLATPTENIVVRNCRVLAGHTLIGIGSELSGGIRNIYMVRTHVGTHVNAAVFLENSTLLSYLCGKEAVGRSVACTLCARGKSGQHRAFHFLTESCPRGWSNAEEKNRPGVLYRIPG